MKLHALFLTAAVSLSVSAFGYLVPHEQTFVAEAEYLYLQPLVENSAYVIQEVAGLPNQRNWNSFNGHSGVRVTGRYGLAHYTNNHLSASWTYVWRQDRDRTISPNADLLLVKWVGGLGTPISTPTQGEFISRLKTTYNDGDLVLNHHLYQQHLFDLYLIGGLQFLSLDYREEINVTDIPNDGVEFNLSQTCDRLGVGLKTGVDVLFSLPCWVDCFGDFALHAKATGALLVSRNDVKIRALNQGVAVSQLEMQNERIDTVVPAFEMKLGLNYLTCLFGKCVAAELGYNIIYYPNLIDQVRFTDVTANSGITFDHYTSFALHGLFVGAGMRF